MFLVALAALAIACTDEVEAARETGTNPCDAELAVYMFRKSHGEAPEACGVWSVSNACVVEQLDPPMVEGRYEGGCAIEGQRVLVDG